MHLDGATARTRRTRHLNGAVEPQPMLATHTVVPVRARILIAPGQTWTAGLFMWARATPARHAPVARMELNGLPMTATEQHGYRDLGAGAMGLQRAGRPLTVTEAKDSARARITS